MTLVAIGIAIGGLVSYTIQYIFESRMPKPIHYTLTGRNYFMEVHECDCKGTK